MAVNRSSNSSLFFAGFFFLRVIWNWRWSFEPFSDFDSDVPAHAQYEYAQKNV